MIELIKFGIFVIYENHSIYVICFYVTSLVGTVTPLLMGGVI